MPPVFFGGGAIERQPGDPKKVVDVREFLRSAASGFHVWCLLDSEAQLGEREGTDSE